MIVRVQTCAIVETIINYHDRLNGPLGYEVNEVAASLCLSPSTVERYRRQFVNFGDINPDVIGRSLNSVSMHPHAEFLIMEAVLRHPDKTLTEIAHDVYVQTGSQYTLAGLFPYLRRNRFSRTKASPGFSSSARLKFARMQIDLIRQYVVLFLIIS